MLIASAHDTILCFSSSGKVYWLRVFQLPQATRNARGKPIVNLLPLGPDERINAILPVRTYDDGHFVFMATKRGLVKKTALSAFSRPRTNGIIAVDLADDDKLVAVDITDGEQTIMLFSDAGKAVRFHESDSRPLGRTARGVRGIRLADGQNVISLIIAPSSGEILTATANGYGKRTPIDDYPIHGRGGQGVIAIQTNDRNGRVVGATDVTAGDDMMLISNKGTMVRTRVDEVSVVGRNTQGVRLINLTEGEHLVGLQRILEIENGDVDEELALTQTEAPTEPRP